jgi:hypothetical protein
MIDEWKTGREPARLTHENHPENRPEAAPADAAPAKKSTLFRTILVSILGGVIGMVYGVAALSSTLTLDEPASLLSVLPLVVALVVLETAYWGAIVCMCKHEVGD